tara:strand:- start:483 stop:980 length:498 start_codon:yes stop_codon:yes gene_type:complete
MNLKEFIQGIIKEEMQTEGAGPRVLKPGSTGGDFRSPIQNALAAAEEDEEESDATAGMSDDEIARLAAQYASEAEFDDIYQEAKGLATARVAQRGHDTVDSGMDAAHRAVVNAGGYESSGMMAFMRTLAQTAEGSGLTPEETLDLPKHIIGMLIPIHTSINAFIL